MQRNPKSTATLQLLLLLSRQQTQAVSATVAALISDGCGAYECRAMVE
jgi:hypothetical protein